MAEIEIDNLEALEANEANEAIEAYGANEANEANEGPGANEQESVSNREKLIRSLVSDDDEVDELTVAGLRQMLDAAPRWFLRQWKMLLLCLAGIFLYITNGYQAQMEMMKESELEAELKDWRYRSITRAGELTLLCRQSQLEQKLREQGDTSLVISKEAPFVIKADE